MWKLSNPLYRLPAVTIVGLLVSIGWGIRGNYGHETGAMLPGALGAMGACLLSQRADWQRRVVYFGFFGMLGWAFGGSISYMMVIGYAHSGHDASQVYGFANLFLIGFLWAGLGGAATALPAVLDDTALKRFFRPLSVALLTWVALYFGQDRAVSWIEVRLGGIDPAAILARHERPLYWLDSDWIPVSVLFASLLVAYFAERRFAGCGRLLAYVTVTGVITYSIFLVTAKTVGNAWLADHFVQIQGAAANRYPVEQLAVTNWPHLFLRFGESQGILYTGEILSLWGGGLVGLVLYCLVHVRCEFPLRLMLWMGGGWWLGFILLPVLGSLLVPDYGGLRMTSPRGDNWAGVLGMLVAAFLVCWFSGYRQLVVAGTLCGVVGGCGFSGAAWLEGMLVSQGNPVRLVSNDVWQAWHVQDLPPADDGTAPPPLPPTPLTYPLELDAVLQAVAQAASAAATDGEPTPSSEPPADDSLEASSTDGLSGDAVSPELAEVVRWQHWQRQNWHSFLEQSYGFVNGLAVLVSLGCLVRRTPPLADSPERPRDWTADVALFCLVVGLAYVNLVKNIEHWTAVHGEDQAALPAAMTAPWIDISLSTWNWFNLGFATLALACVVLQLQSRRRPLAILPPSWLGRGQLLLLVILWTFVAGNLSRVLPYFTADRLLTEGVICFNAIAVTTLVLLLPGEADEPVSATTHWTRLAWQAFALLVVLGVTAPVLEAWSLRRVYGDAPTAKRGMDFRFGPHANWIRSPLLKRTTHP